MSENILSERLRRSGFLYNPFTSLESSRDPHLAKHIYLGNETFSIAKESVSVAVFAPVGGGKTALRIYTAQSCWKGAEPHRSLPVTMLLTPTTFAREVPSAKDHSHALMRAIIRSLFVDVLLHPESFLDLSADLQKQVSAYLRAFLPSPLDHYRLQASNEADLASLLADLDRSTRGVPLPPITLIAVAFDRLETIISTSLPRNPLPALTTLILEKIGHRALFVLMDGLDGVEETVAKTENAARWLEPLLQLISRYERKGIYLKGFFPEEMTKVLQPLIFAELPRANNTTIEWDEQLLTEMLRRRIWAATDGAMDSFDSFAEFGMQDVERQIVVRLPGDLRLPREVIALTATILDVLSERAEETGGLLSKDDLNLGLERYWNSNLAYTPSSTT